MTRPIPDEPRPAYIYALVDPFSGLVRYIGKSVRPRERLVNQCNERANTHRCHWIQSVLAKGSRPLQVIVAVVPAGGDWQSVERAWIQVARELGWPLVNGTDGDAAYAWLAAVAVERLACCDPAVAARLLAECNDESVRRAVLRAIGKHSGRPGMAEHLAERVAAQPVSPPLLHYRS